MPGLWHLTGFRDDDALTGRHQEMRTMTGRRARGFAVVVGGLRMASGISFLIAPEAANRLWGDEEDSGPTASLLLRSMGYRDALVGGMLLWSGLRNSRTMPGWFLASAGADAADLAGGIANHGRMSDSAKLRGLGGAAVGIGVGVLGAASALAGRGGRRR
jgi:hypothetical protein